jgi:thiol-disulfide isomerase/thioredoxin
MTMRNGLALLLVALAAGFPTSAAADASSALRQHCLHDLHGEELDLSDLSGRIVVVNFWASWCKPCRTELPVFDAWHREIPADEVAFAAISIDQDVRKARRFVEREGLQLPVYHDGSDGLARELDLPYLPCTYLIDQAGRVVLVSSGATEEKLAELRRAIDGLRGSDSVRAGISGGKP